MRNILILLVFIGFACNSVTEKKVFKHELESESKPWSSELFDEPTNRFSFAITSDLTGGEREGVFSSAIEKINLLRPEFILSVGDLIEGGVEDVAQLEKEFDSFDERAAKAYAPFFHVGGNHDLTNSIMTEFWNERYGASYYHFIYKDVLFLILNSEDYSEERMQEIYLARDKVIQLINEGVQYDQDTMEYYQMPERVTGTLGEEQIKYFEEVLQKNSDVKWTFLFMHKPVWQREGKGNLDILEEALSDRPYTLFNGHFHNFSYTERKGRDYTILGTTGGSQNPNSSTAFDHFTWVTMTEDGPTVAHIKLEGILDKEGND